MKHKKSKKIKIVILSGKGGVGKSMLASALAMLFNKNKKTIAVDCDVDTPNLAIWLGEPGKWKAIWLGEPGKWKTVKKISVSEKPIINNSKLTPKKAQHCVKKCKFNALNIEKGKLKLNPFLCEGCGACEFFCPAGAIKMKPIKNGEIKTKKTKYNFPLVSGHLFVGETGSGKIVTEVKKVADKFEYNIMLIDSSPGTGCPVIAAVQDSNFAILITEPTPSGLADLNRVLKVINHFKIPYKVVINKWDINSKMSEKIEKSFKNKLLGKISYDKKIFKAIANLTPILETNLKAKQEIKNIYNKLIDII